MPEMLSPGVYVQEIDASQIVPTTSSSTAVFCGMFEKGSCGDYNIVNSVSDLIDIYGKPNSKNYNDWYQCYNFLQYGSNLLVARAVNLNGKSTLIEGAQVTKPTIEEVIQQEVQEVKATSIIGTSKLEGISGNNLLVEVTKGAPLTIQEETTAECLFAVSKRSGSTGNNYRIVITGSTGKWNIVVNNGETDVFSKQNYTKDTIVPTELDNPYVTFKAVALKVSDARLAGGKDLVQEDRYNVTTKLNGIKKETQISLKSSSDLKDNQYISWTKDIPLFEETYKFNGGVDYVEGIYGQNDYKVGLRSVVNLNKDNIIQFKDNGERFLVKSIDTFNRTIELDRKLTEDTRPEIGDNVYTIEMDFNGSCSAVDASAVTNTSFNYNGDVHLVKVPNDVGTKYDTFKDNKQILNYVDWEDNETSIPFTNPAIEKIKFISRNPGTWCTDLRICIAKPEVFKVNCADLESYIPHYAFEGIVVDDLFEYAPYGDQFGVCIAKKTQDGFEVQEVYTVSLDETAKDSNNKSLYIENVINRNSSLVYCNVNTSNKDELADYTLVYDDEEKTYVGKNLRFTNSSDSSIQQDDLMDAYDLFRNSDEIDIDIVIGNELDNGLSAKNLADTRQDCIAYIGCPYDLVVRKKSNQVVKNLENWRRKTINYNTCFCACFGNYKKQYDRYNDVYRWVNIAGDCAGLQAKVATNKYPWYASAGLNNGQISNVYELAFNPEKSQTDTLYKNSINPICTFPGQGTVLWGQKTLQDKASSFDRINVRALFNTIERALKKMSRYQVMELNDSFTRNRIIAMMKPYLDTVKANRGIQDYMVVCDESNNTNDIISRNQLIVDIYIKPTYVAEFILLRFTNAGVNDFSSVISTVS